MTATAVRLGHSQITLDWSNLSRTSTPIYSQFQEAWKALRERVDRGDVGFYNAPIQNELSQAAESQALADEILRDPRFNDCLFLGIGGSALGPASLLSSLRERSKSRIRFHFVDNPDPLEWKSTLLTLNPESTLVCVVTKSGTTFETVSQMLLALEWLGKERWKSHVVAITDPTKGDLKEFARQQGISTLHIAPSMGGRFSIFTPVGLFAAALAGLSIKDFLKGSQEIREYLEKVPTEKNPLLILGHELIHYYPQRSVHVCMPYSTRLRSVGSWFSQLWGESLGKDGKGFTPLAAVGATDQHSILQLLRDGPDDKVTFFITVDQVDDPVTIPRAPQPQGAGRFASFELLQGHTLQELLTVEYRATSLVLTRRNRPYLTFQLDRLDERALGALYFSLSCLTALTGILWGINPFDQPGVEEGKVYTRDALTADKRSREEEADENSPLARLRGDRS